MHDVLIGYDYVKERFSAEQESWTTRSGRVKSLKLKIGVVGQLVGGSLASMLALTESHLAQDRIAAAAVNSPINDWVFPEQERTIEDVLKSTSAEETEKPSRRKRKGKRALSSWEASDRSEDGLSTDMLETLRKDFFKKPVNYFDPFASPIHFFRSPSVVVPQDPTLIMDGEDPLSVLASTTTKPRKAHRTFPPSNSTLILPSFRLSTGSQNPLLDSNEECVKVLRRSVMRSALKRSNVQVELDRFEEDELNEDERLEAAVQEAEEKVEWHVGEGPGLWGTSGRYWREEVQRVGKWFRRVLG